ncbi:MAG: hypothetical protein QXP36_04195 [Conexivisphaerales archaeon]|uniref:hypothetical protein n=1 Tax=Saccharolobus sp. TaxID=2100761 RepID=UPI00316DBFA4
MSEDIKKYCIEVSDLEAKLIFLRSRYLTSRILDFFIRSNLKAIRLNNNLLDTEKTYRNIWRIIKRHNLSDVVRAIRCDGYVYLIKPRELFGERQNVV